MCTYTLLISLPETTEPWELPKKSILIWSPTAVFLLKLISGLVFCQCRLQYQLIPVCTICRQLLSCIRHSSTCSSSKDPLVACSYGQRKARCIFQVQRRCSTRAHAHAHTHTRHPCSSSPMKVLRIVSREDVSSLQFRYTSSISSITRDLASAITFYSNQSWAPMLSASDRMRKRLAHMRTQTISWEMANMLQ
jgi:hypothetical protein